MIGSCDVVLLQSFVYIASFPQVIAAIVKQGPWATIFRLLKKGPAHMLDGLLLLIAIEIINCDFLRPAHETDDALNSLVVVTRGDMTQAPTCNCETRVRPSLSFLHGHRTIDVIQPRHP